MRGMSHTILRMFAGRAATRPMTARLRPTPSSDRKPFGVIISNGPVTVSKSVNPADW